MFTIKLLEKNILPDAAIRKGIRNLLKMRLDSLKKSWLEDEQESFMKMVSLLKKDAIAVETDKANEQHYELPSIFFEKVLGPYLKYSSGSWKNSNDLESSEKEMLELTVSRADLKDGQNILELGCGWGSLTTYMAQKYPNAKITAVSNSASQKKFIDSRLEKQGLTNVNVITADVTHFETEQKFERVVSVEMFEHIRNYEQLLGKINNWLADDGKLFVHIFAHHKYTYLFEVNDETDWMAKYFFTGGVMPSNHLFFYFNNDLVVKNHWQVDGRHYSKTLEAWLEKMTKQKPIIYPILQDTYGKENARKWWVYWRTFFMACSELFAYNNGHEWMVNHYLFTKK
ncbi:cyclopropane-fatty-acyl-phospholipid synthase family protein [Candidatus Uabimicrobium sp. HlEnr_7]|uniref:SAM-dependent methyltransferase n=1 Tax=Candidatus Uabimicrobium helgolandensis TaxID=3095367 RepID=UPI0035568CBF